MEKVSEVQNRLGEIKAIFAKAESEKERNFLDMNREKENFLKIESKIDSCEAELKESIESESRQTQLFATFEKRKNEVAENQKKEKIDFIQNCSAEKEALKTRTESAKIELSEIETSIAQIQAEISQSAQSKTKNEYQMKILTDDLASNQKTVSENQKILDEIEPKLLILTEHVESRKTRLEQEESNRLEDEKYLAVLEEQILDAKTLAENFRAEISSKKSELSEFSDNVGTAEENVRSKNIEIEEISAELEHIQKLIDESKLRSEKFRGTIEAKNSHTEFTTKCQG